MTTRGFEEAHFRDMVAGFLDRAACLAQELQRAAGSKKLSAFISQMEGGGGSGVGGGEDGAEGSVAVRELKADVEAFARGFYYPGGAEG